jgi:hypothetical protein
MLKWGKSVEDNNLRNFLKPRRKKNSHKYLHKHLPISVYQPNFFSCLHTAVSSKTHGD